MNGLDKIIERIDHDAQAEIDAVIARARDDAAAIRADYQTQAETLTQTILDRGRQEAGERERRLESLASLEGRKRILAAKQEMLEKAFDLALEKLLSLPQESYVELLSDLCAQAALTGREEVIFSEKDRDKLGKKVVARANEKLAQAVAPKLPDEVTSSTAGAILNKVVTAGSALLAGTGMLTVAQETRPIQGGVILVGDGVEVNCAFDTLVRLARPQLEREVAAILFEAP